MNIESYLLLIFYLYRDTNVYGKNLRYFFVNYRFFFSRYQNIFLGNIYFIIYLFSCSDKNF